ncbi:hypothetical protein GCM10020001_110810 [Nonomuraea salmonea]
MRADNQISDQKLMKADFNDIYHQPDPRPYYDRLGSLDYAVPPTMDNASSARYSTPSTSTPRPWWTCAAPTE